MEDRIRKYREDPVAFIEELMGYKLTAFQKDFIKFFCENKDKQIYILMGRSNWRNWMNQAALLIKENEEMAKKMMLNPDREHVAKIRDAIRENEGHCPCELEWSEDTICPCKKMREEQICHCKLYVERE